jgi:phosphate transport system permease protein
MSTTELAPAGPTVPPGPVTRGSGRERTGSWPLLDRVGYWLSWATGIGLCLVALAIVLFMFVKGISYLKLSMFVQSPAPEALQSKSGGFLDPIVGTLIVAVLGTLIATPIGIAIAIWLSEYRRPSWLARTVESAIEVIAGTPSVVLALFGLLIFAQGFLAFLSQRAADGQVYGRSFFAASAVMAVLALPLIVASTREALSQLPDRLREASYALGRTRATSVRRILLPSIRPGIATGTVLGMGRIIGDTAIIKILLGVQLVNEGVGSIPIVSALRGTGATLTTFVYENSPAGEGNAPQKAYAAAFVLMLMVLCLNGLVTWITGRGGQADRQRRGRAWLLLRFSGVSR